MEVLFDEYRSQLAVALATVSSERILDLGRVLEEARSRKKQVFLCGNGGSAANAVHWANNLLFGAAQSGRGGLKVHALPANPAVMTCLANDVSYERVFADQLRVLGSEGDLLIAFSGSGNSPNIVQALETSRQLGIQSWAILGFDGGKAPGIADQAVHFAVNNMQIAEDCHMILGHMVTRFLARPT